MSSSDSDSFNIWHAAADGDLECVKNLIEKEEMFSPISVDTEGYNPIQAAISYGQLELLTYFKSYIETHRAIMAQTELRMLTRLALDKKLVSTTESLEQAYFSINDVNDSSWIPVDENSSKFESKTIDFVHKIIQKYAGANSENDMDIKKMLQDFSDNVVSTMKDLDPERDYGQTKVYIQDRLEILKKIFDNTSNPESIFQSILNTGDKDGDTSYHHFATNCDDLTENVRTKVFSFLKNNGADPSIKNNEGYDAFETCLQDPDEISRAVWFYKVHGKEVSEQDLMNQISEICGGGGGGSSWDIEEEEEEDDDEEEDENEEEDDSEEEEDEVEVKMME